MSARAGLDEQPDVERKAAVEAFFDQEADEYFARYRTPENILSQRRMLRLLGSARCPRILDIGCGPGTIVEDLLDVGDHVAGLDLSERMVAAAKARFSDPRFKDRVEFRVGDAARLPFPSEHFDAVICAGVLRYLPSLNAGLLEIRRVLKPGGVAIMTFYYRFSPHWWSMCLFYRPFLPVLSLMKGRSLSDAVMRWRGEPLPFSYWKFLRTLETIGMTYVTTEHAGFDLFPFNRLFPRLSRFWYLKAEPVLADSNTLGWLGSICIVKVVR
jgi:ubiquinone/menaquinone biosynthesis C-methylase UbiE